MKVIAVIQQRLSSTRLPGKALLPLAGKSMTQNIVERVQRAKLVDDVILAIPRRDMKFFDIQYNFPLPSLAVYTGDEDDLIGRFLFAAIANNADFIIRICGDNPCIEPEYLDWLASQIPSLPSPLHGLWLNSENFLNGHDGFGGEIYSVEMLYWMDDTIKGVRHREHPHTFWKDLGLWTYVGKDYPKGFRLDVNTPEEYEKLVKIYDHFGNNLFHVEEAIEYVRTHDLAERAIPAGERSEDQRL